MEKKQYIAPAIEIAELEAVETILAGSDLKGTISDDNTEEDAWMSNDRRGSWGNLWDDGEKK